MILLVESSITGLIGAVGSIVAVAISIFLYLLSRKKKTLSYELLSEYSLISIDHELRSKLKVLYEGNPVERVHLLLFKFLNSGNVPITASDFDRALNIHLSGDSTVLSADPVKSSPENLRVSLSVEKQDITFQPVLMNGGDYFTVKVLVGEYGGSFEIDARIVGVKLIRAARRPQREWFFKEWRFRLLAILAALLILVSLAVSYKTGATRFFAKSSPTPLPQPTPYTTSAENTTALVIPNSGRASYYPANIDISGLSGSIDKVTVVLRNAIHTNTNDLEIILAGPSGKRVALMAGVGGAFRNSTLIFEDRAGPLQPDRSGTYQPTTRSQGYVLPDITHEPIYKELGVFTGDNPNGTWALYVFDKAGGDQGQIAGGWKLQLTIKPRETR